MKRIIGLILKVAGLLLLLLIVVSVLNPLAPPRLGTEGKKIKARVEVTQLRLAAQGYRSDYRQWPAARNNPELVSILSGSNLNQVVYMEFANEIREGKGIFLDPWQHPYHFQILSNEFRAWSSGSDGRNDSGEKDDVTSWKDK